MIKYITKDMPQYKANLHSHSNLSDGELTPREMKDAYKAHGYSVLCITDHERTYDHSAMTEPDFLMLTGYESHLRSAESGGKGFPYVPETHICLLAKDPHNVTHVNFDSRYCKYAKTPEEIAAIPKAGSVDDRDYSVEYVNNFFKVANEAGYLCTHNHPVWSLELNERSVAYRGFFSMEICNYASFAGNRMEYNGPLYDRMLREGMRVYCHAADDNHNRNPLDSAASDSFGGFTMILAKELTYPSVIEALEKGDFYASMGPKILELTFDGKNVHIETEPVRQITMLRGCKSPTRKVGSLDKPVTSADFVIPDDAPYVRFDVYDFEGNHANTRGFFRDELGI